MKYVLRPTQNDILHYGVDHLHSKDGRGSGRYPWGSGKEGGKDTKKAIKTVRKSINTIAKQSKIIDDNNNLVKGGHKAEKIQNAKKEFDQAKAILGKERVEEIIRDERYRNLKMATVKGILLPNKYGGIIGTVAVNKSRVNNKFDKASKYLGSSGGK